MLSNDKQLNVSLLKITLILMFNIYILLKLKANNYYY